jgi:hypothetical protein
MSFDSVDRDFVLHELLDTQSSESKTKSLSTESKDISTPSSTESS